MSVFSLANSKLLKVEVKGEKVMSKAGAMVAYEGSIKFEKSLLANEGVLGMFKRAVTNESFNLMVANGSGTVFYAHNGMNVKVIQLNNQKVFIESSSILAYDSSLKTDTVFKGAKGAVSGQGLFTTTVEGTGALAVISDGDLLAFQVDNNNPLFVDPDAFIGYEGNINTDFVFDVNLKTFLGQSSGESFQFKFTGQGTVYVQPSERR